MAELRTIQKTTRIVSLDKFIVPDCVDLSTCPVFGSQAVLWLVDGVWQHKGWLMPEGPYRD